MDSSLQERVANDVLRRGRFITSDVNVWTDEILQAAEDNKNGFGIHRSQLRDIKASWDEILARKQVVEGQLKPGLETDLFVDKRLELGRILAGSGAILEFLKAVFTQREDAQYRVSLDEADLVAASCYLKCTQLAVEWGALDAANVRTPPLTYLNGELSPTAGTRQKNYSALSFPLHYFRETLLPVPFVFLPFDHARSIWTYCALHHEVGHVLTLDLGLMDELPSALTTRLTQSNVSKKRQDYWQLWLYEIIADTFGILLAGVAYAHLMIDVLLRSTQEVAELNPEDPHPNHYVRMHLLCALLRKSGSALLAGEADKIQSEWDGIYEVPGWASEFLNDCSLVAEVLLLTPLARLQSRPLPDLVGNLEQQEALIRQLAQALSGKAIYPPPALQRPLTHSIVPPAALLALADTPAAFDQIDSRSRLYLQALPRPAWLDSPAPGTDHNSFVRKLAGALDFRAFGG